MDVYCHRTLIDYCEVLLQDGGAGPGRVVLRRPRCEGAVAQPLRGRAADRALCAVLAAAQHATQLKLTERLTERSLYGCGLLSNSNHFSSHLCMKFLRLPEDEQCSFDFVNEVLSLEGF